MMFRFLLKVSLLLLLFTCALSANVATKRHREHRRLRHQLTSRVVRHRDNPLKEIAANTDSAAEDTQATLGLNSAPEVAANTDEAVDDSENGGDVPQPGGGPLNDIAANTDAAAEGIENVKQGQQPAATGVLTGQSQATGQDDPKPCRYGGGTVESGWKGPGFGGNSCNSCSCNDGMLICTEIGCAAGAAPAAALAGAPASAPKKAGAEADDSGDDDGEDDDSGDDTAVDEAEEARLQLAITKATKALAENRHKQEKLRKKKALLEDVDMSNQEIDAHVRLVTHETESAAMAGMLGNMWKDIRMLEAHDYIKFLEEQIKKLKKKEPLLKQDLASAEAALARKQAEPDEGVPASAAMKEVPAKMEHVPMPINTTLSAAQNSSQWQPWWMKMRTESISGGLVSFACGLIFALLYYLVRKRQGFFKFDQEHREGVWTIGIFGCFTNKWMCFGGCCCPFARWADTVDRAKVGFSYVPAVVLMLFLMVLNPYTYGVTGLMVVALGVKCRQSLRKKYYLPFGRGTYAEDCLVWCFCQPCAIIQEAHAQAWHDGFDKWYEAQPQAQP